MKKYISIIACLLLFLSIEHVFAQQDTIDISKMSREEVLNIPYEQLIDMPLDQLLMLADIVGVSLEELYELILNKDVVSASKKVESSFEAPLSTSVISYDEIIASGARNVEEALRLVPGLIVREKTNGNFDVHLRGNNNLPPKHMFVYSENSISLVMINNRPVYNYVHGGTFWETLPIGIDDIERIEVVRGPSSALYGPNAVSGVVNIITKKAESKELKATANIQAGNLNTQIGSFGIGKKVTDKLGIRFTGNYYHQDRSSDKFYVYKTNSFLTVDELGAADDIGAGIDTSTGDYYKIFDPGDDTRTMFPDPKLGRENMSGNLNLTYDVNEDINFDLSTGYQSSSVISSTMGDNPIPLTGRVSNTGYIDLHAKVHGFRAQVNILDGWQDIIKEDTGFKVDVRNINANVEYDININNLNIRPGIAYQQALYSDKPYLRYSGQGFINGEKQLNSMSATLRADYLAFEQLRLIAALRGDKYNTHDDPYLSYQLIAAYNLNNKHLFRAVYSKANRGPFLVDSYADFYWERDQRPVPGAIHFKGQQNLDLLTMNQIELGYRIKPLKNIQIDIEAFKTISDNYGALYPDSANRFAFVQMVFKNIDMKSKQTGITAAISYVVNQDLNLKIFGTYQKSKLYDVIPQTQDEMVQNMMIQSATSGGLVNNFITKQRVDQLNEATPSIYGGFIINYSFLDQKANLNINSYFYTTHTIETKYSKLYGDEDDNAAREEIEAKEMFSVKLSYKVYKENSVFINARNILQESREFSYMDPIGSYILGGIQLNF